MTITTKNRTATITTIVPSVTIRAQQMAKVADALCADPTDRRAKIARALLEKQGALDCPSCGVALRADGVRETRTAFEHKRAIVCGGCKTSFVVDERHVA